MRRERTITPDILAILLRLDHLICVKITIRAGKTR
jgi:hypothetical protein